MGYGELIVRVYADNIAQPVEGALVEIIGEGTYVKSNTNENGEIEGVVLKAPDKKYCFTEEPKEMPCAKYIVKVSKIGMINIVIKNIEIYESVISYQDVFLKTLTTEEKEEIIDIEDNTLYKKSDPKLQEEPIKNEEKYNTKTSVIVPEYITVHNGIPTNFNEANYYVSFINYIKNVLSSNIYPIWKEEAIKANAHIIISSTLNRIYTEWYKLKGYPFTVTASTIYDVKYVHNRTIFNTISKIVDEVFNVYIKVPNTIQPLFAQCVNSENKKEQEIICRWESQKLAGQGYKAIDIIKNYYGDNVSLEKAETSFDQECKKCSVENNCRQILKLIQIKLNTIAGSYPAIPKIERPDGEFNEETKRAVEEFQKKFLLNQTRNIDFITCYNIMHTYKIVKETLESINF
ncbi:MAG: peptidoglycan-binding domain-containing protein [Clostridia bacterium]|nr:peptidoglycan-binding domain-containing protein [Clostridia bacterium]MDD4376088.1 peptidoglycan-binding domain-containing protein [Clostridia bacterium]